MRLAAICLTVALLLPNVALAQLRVQDGLDALVASDAETAREIWEKLAERGDVLAQYNLGLLLLMGQGVAPDRAAALGLIEAAATQDHLPAQRLLADVLMEAEDWAAARHWYARAAAQGDAQAQFALGVLKEQGLGGNVAPERAQAQYAAAADQGYVPAIFALGALLAEAGEAARAADKFERAAEAGHVEAKHNLGVALSQGLGRAQDAEAARGWYLRAAQAGHAPAAHNLALMLAQGRGGARSFRRALAWALVAYEAGHAPAQTLVATLREIMAADVIAAAEAMAAACAEDPATCE